MYLAYVQADNTGAVLAPRQQDLGRVLELLQRVEAPWRVGLGWMGVEAEAALRRAAAGALYEHVLELMEQLPAAPEHDWDAHVAAVWQPARCTWETIRSPQWNDATWTKSISKKAIDYTIILIIKN